MKHRSGQNVAEAYSRQNPHGERDGANTKRKRRGKITAPLIPM
jgi:hypothetical protein